MSWQSGLFVKLLDWAKSQKTIMVSFWILSLFALLAPQRFWTFLALDQSTIKPWCGATFAILSALLAVYGIAYVIDAGTGYVKRTVTARRALKAQQGNAVQEYTQRRNIIDALSKGERVILREFFLRGERFVVLNRKNPYVADLARKHILRVTDQRRSYHDLYYAIDEAFAPLLTRKDVLLPETINLDAETQWRIKQDRQDFLFRF